MREFLDFLKHKYAYVAVGEFKPGRFAEAQRLYEKAVSTYGKGFKGAFLLQKPGTDEGIAVIMWEKLEDTRSGTTRMRRNNKKHPEKRTKIGRSRNLRMEKNRCRKTWVFAYLPSLFLFHSSVFYLSSLLSLRASACVSEKQKTHWLFEFHPLLYALQ